MPGLNGTGPMGRGTGTGRGAGNCGQAFSADMAGRGFGRGLGRSMRCKRNNYGTGNLQGLVSEIETLKNRIKELETNKI